MRAKVLVTGAGGQLGQTIQAIAIQYPTIHFLFLDKNNLDITNAQEVLEFFKNNSLDWCINCAAYTAVDYAETNQEQAYQINVLGARNVAKACFEYEVKLIHISTDFVFDGKSNMAYTEEDSPNPLNIYGKTKLQGEIEISSNLTSYFILRTSWLFSEFGLNFLLRMLKLAKYKKEISVVDNQVGTPTYARDLAEFMVHLIVEDRLEYGLYNYSSEGVASWYDFAKAIFEISDIPVEVKPISSNFFPTAAKRPNFSVLDNSKLREIFNIDPPYWRDSTKLLLLKLELFQ